VENRISKGPSERHWARPSRADLLLVALAAACLGLAWAFAKLGSEVLEGELVALDSLVRGWMAQHRSPAGVAVFRVLTNLGAREVLAPVGILLGWRLFRGTRAAIALLAFTALAAAEYNSIVKRVFEIRRPATGVLAGLGFSFPSGHTTGSAAIAVVVSYMSLRRRNHPHLVVPLCVACTLVVGVSRVYLDVHWASDVIGGWIIGAMFGVGCCAVYELMHRREAFRSR
jgi:undecaprenyl-diphosphatase